MNSFMQTQWPWVEGLHALRDGILATLTDADLDFCPGGANGTFGELFVATGEIQYSYIASLETFAQDWSYRNTEPAVASSVADITAWFTELDERLKATVSAFSEADLKKDVVRAGGGTLPVELQLQSYMQAVFIFLGKAVVYLRAMNKPLPPMVEEYIG